MMFGRRFLQSHKRWVSVAFILAMVIVDSMLNYVPVLLIAGFVHDPTPTTNNKDNYIRDVSLNLRISRPVSVNVSCKMPALMLWPEPIRKQFRIRPPIKCYGEDWVRIHNGTVYLTDVVTTPCTMYPITFVTDFESAIGDGIVIENGTRLVSDFILVKCKTTWRSLHNQPYPGVTHKMPPLSYKPPWPKEGNPMNVLIVGYDSVSRLNWIRNMPKSYHYFTAQLAGVVYESYNVIGGGTFANFIAVFTGHTQYKSAISEAKAIDDYPWIWNDLKKLGYATQWGEDDIRIASFEDFKKPPVDHYYRTFMQVAGGPYNLAQCLGGKSRHARMLDWCADFFTTYSRTPKVSIIFQAELSHSNMDGVQVADGELTQFLASMEKAGHLDNTLLIMMSDHGLRAAAQRSTQQGKFEESLPFFGIRPPPWFKTRYPKVWQNIQTNAFRLTTPLDVYTTVRHLTEVGPDNKYIDSSRIGQSMFTEVSRNRRCRDAGIRIHNCACLNPVASNKSDARVLQAAQVFVDALNLMLFKVTDKCARVKLKKIHSASTLVEESRTLNNEYVPELLGDIANVFSTGKLIKTYYQLMIITSPGDALFDVTMPYDGTDFEVDFKSVTRITWYREQSICIASQHKQLAPFCCCKQL